MASIVNARDVLLQATSPRLIDVFLPGNIIPEATKAITLSPSTAVFKISADGSTVNPSSITFTASRKYVAASISFSVIEGSATLTGSGDTRTLTFANMATERVVIQISATENSISYVSTSTVLKVKDGTNGANGTNGTNGVDGRRGSVDLYVLGSFWSDSVANNAIISATGSATKYAGDKVTIYNNAGFAETKYWDGISAWVTGQIINGNVLVSGTVTSNAIGTNTLSAVNIDTTGRIKAEGDSVAYAGYPQYRGAIFGVNYSLNGNTDYRKGVIGYSLGGAGVSGLGDSGSSGTYGSAIGVQGVGYAGGDFRSNVSNGIGVYGQGFTGGLFLSDQANGVGLSCSASGTSSVSLRIVGTGRVQWGSYTYSEPPGSPDLFMNAAGQWIIPGLATDANNLGGFPANTYVRRTGTSGTAGALGGYLIVTNGVTSVKIPFYAL